MERPGEAIPGAQVIARRKSDGLRFEATTDADGRYEFPPLPPGRYELIMNPIGSFQPDRDEVNVSRGQCWSVALTKHPHARLGGRLQRADGSPLPHVDVLFIAADETSFNTGQSDEHGYFQFDSLRPGEYVIGINLPGAPVWKSAAGAGPGLAIPPVSLYYPGVPNRSGALAIKLEEDEKRDDLNFTVPE